MKLTNDQLKALELFKEFLISKDKYLIVQGLSGTGKSFLIEKLIQISEKYVEIQKLLEIPHNFTILVTATTNQAASVLDYTEAITIHSALGLKPFNDYNTGKTSLKQNKTIAVLDSDDDEGILFIDEASMIDPELFKYIDAVNNFKIVLIGDWHQLPPVNCTKILMKEMSDAGVKTANLETIVRNRGHIASEGLKLKNAVNTHQFDPILVDGKSVIHLNGNDFKEAVNQEFSKASTDLNRAKILAFTNNAVIGYIQHIRSIKGLSMVPIKGEYVLTNKPICACTGGRDQVVAPTDSKVLIKQIYKTENGFEIKLNVSNTNYFLPEYPEYTKQMLKQAATKKDWKEYFKIKSYWLDLRLPYASTIHKAQGATYQKVFINLTDIGKCWDPDMTARLLYVAFTRASEQVILYGDLPPKYGGIQFV